MVAQTRGSCFALDFGQRLPHFSSRLGASLPHFASYLNGGATNLRAGARHFAHPVAPRFRPVASGFGPGASPIGTVPPIGGGKNGSKRK